MENLLNLFKTLGLFHVKHYAASFTTAANPPSYPASEKPRMFHVKHSVPKTPRPYWRFPQIVENLLVLWKIREPKNEPKIMPLEPKKKELAKRKTTASLKKSSSLRPPKMFHVKQKKPRSKSSVA